MGKYDPLRDYLINCDSDEITLSFADIEAIIGGALPPSASAYDAWWANAAEGAPTSHTHAASWRDAGYRAQVDRAGRKARFSRADPGAARFAALRLHLMFERLPRYDWKNIDAIPYENGVYVVYERGETYQGHARIVRVGTHTAQNRLKTRLKDHFVREDHNASILRKHIGKALLNRDKDPYIETWSLDTSRTANVGQANRKLENQIERRVSEYMRTNLSFTVFPADTAAQRLRLEEAVVAALHKAKDFGPSNTWLGLHSPQREIRESGLWLKHGLNAAPLTPVEALWLNHHLNGIRQGEPADYGVGDRLRHDAFGEGTVLSVRGIGSDALIEVDFDGVGRKKLSAWFAGAHIERLTP